MPEMPTFRMYGYIRSQHPPACSSSSLSEQRYRVKQCSEQLDLDGLIFWNVTWTCCWISRCDNGMRNWGGGGGGEEVSATVVTEHPDINPRYREIHKSAADEIATSRSPPWWIIVSVWQEKMPKNPKAASTLYNPLRNCFCSPQCTKAFSGWCFTQVNWSIPLEKYTGCDALETPLTNNEGWAIKTCATFSNRSGK